MDEPLVDRAHIREQVQNWVVWRDSGNWDRFRTVWHVGARMNTTWFSGPVEDFIGHARRAFERGAITAHFLGGTAVELNGARAVAQTKKRIESRQAVEGVLCDLVCVGRFYQFFEKRNERWAIVLHQGIYEKDRIDPVDRNAMLALDPKLLEEFPEGYRHFAYAQIRASLPVKRDLPGLRGAAVERLYAAGAAFLGGAPAEF